MIAPRPSALPNLLSAYALLRLARRTLPARAMERCPSQSQSPRVLSIQSHVVSGYVGNKSATFPLQVLGFEVDAINTVQFSNHTGYGVWKGLSLTEEGLGDLTAGLAHNGLDLAYTHILTGYNRSKPFLLRVAKLISELRSKNPNLMYYCDPVMGDIGRDMYVPKELLEVYRDAIIPLASVITPNQFEVELLIGKQVSSIDDAWNAITSLHNLGPQFVVVSSFEISGDASLYCLGSVSTGDKKERISLSFPKLAGDFTGTGDLFSALLLAWMWQTKNNLKDSMELTLATLQSVLQRTIGEDAVRPSPKWKKELKLIQSKIDIEKPHVRHFACYV